jgi:hypothetical protein
VVIPHWLCKTCYDKHNKEPLDTYPLNASTATSRLIDHMEDAHNYTRLGVRQGSPRIKKRRLNTLQAAWKATERTHKQVFDEDGWREAYYIWIASTGVSLH